MGVALSNIAFGNEEAKIQQEKIVEANQLLIEGAWNLSSSMVSTALENGAQLESTENEYGRTALSVLVRKWNSIYHPGQLQQEARDCMKLLLEKGAETDKDESFLAMCRGIRHGNTEAVELLLEYGTKAHIKLPGYPTALHIATFYKRTEFLRLLLNKGADPKAVHKDSVFHEKSACDLALDNGFAEGLNLFKRSRYGDIPLKKKTRNTLAKIISFHSNSKER